MKYFITVLLSLSLLQSAYACTDFRLANSGPYSMSGRTMDFQVDLQSQIVIVPRGQEHQSVLQDGSPGLKWKAQYGYVGVNGFHIDGFTDGLNEAGLSVATLWLPHLTQYPTPEDYPGKSVVPVTDAARWILGNFKNVDEVKKALDKTIITGYYVEKMKMIPPLHLAIHDAEGNDLVVEFIDGRTKIHDNKSLVLTNYPDYGWHIKNLQNYANLTNKNADNPDISPTGNGSGLKGLPGDATPPSRFVQAYFLNRYSPEPKSLQEAVSNTLHVLNAVQLANGEVAEGDYTQWSVVRDHQNKVYYFRDNLNQNLRGIALEQLDLGTSADESLIPMASSQWFQNVLEMAE